MDFEQGQLGSEDDNEFRPDGSAKEGYTSHDEQHDLPTEKQPGSSEDEQKREAEEAERARVRDLSEVELIREMSVCTDQLAELGQLDESYADVVANPGREGDFQILVDEDRRRTQELGEKFIAEARDKQQGRGYFDSRIAVVEVTLVAREARAEFSSISDKVIRAATTREVRSRNERLRAEARRKYLGAVAAYQSLSRA
ncbi:MAG: hypothetical protein WC553_03665 [Patescibacteria group bacterium]|jgi:hypothetical protein